MQIDLSAPTVMLSSDGRSRLLLARSDTYNIQLLNQRGETTGYLSRAIARRKVSRTDAWKMKTALLVARLTGKAAGSPRGGGTKQDVDVVLPKYVPAITSLVAGDSYVLVSGGHQKKKSRQWDVLDYNNRFHGLLTMPKGFTPLAVRDDKLYGQEGSGSGRAIAVYRITPSR